MKAPWVRALAILWATQLGTVAFGTVGLVAVVLVGGADPASFFDLAATGIRHVSIPHLRQTLAADLDLAIGYVAINGSVTLLLWSLLPLLRLTDPGRSGGGWRKRWAGGWRRVKREDPSLLIFLPFGSFRRIGDRSLRPLYPRLVAVPFLVPLVLGLMFAAVVVHGLEAGALVRSALVRLAYLYPHGLLELTAIFLPMAVLLGLYLETRGAFEAGDVEGVWAVLRAETRFARFGGRMLASLVLVAAAALVEAHVTEDVAAAVASWLG